MIKDKPTDRGIPPTNDVPQSRSQNDISKKTFPKEERITHNNREAIYKNEWERVTFDDAPLEIIDGDRGLNYPKQHDFKANGYCLFLNAGNVTEEGFNFSSCSFISKERDKLMRKGKLSIGDLVLTTRGTIGNVAIFNNSVQFDNIRINSGMVLLRSDTYKLLPTFLYYSLKSQFCRNQMNALITGSAQPQLPIQDIRKLKIYLPPLSEQLLITHFLGFFDKKIKLNQKMNKTLEAIAQAIFKHWFIDFEFPNEEGKPYKSSGGEMVESDLGLIPKNWCIKKLDNVANFLNGLALQKYPATSEKDYLPVIKIKEIHSGISDSSDKASGDIPPEYIVNDGDVLFAWSGSLGISIWCNGEGALNQHIFKVTSDEYPKWFYYEWLLHYLPGFKEVAKDKATTMGHIQRHHLSESLVI